MNPNIPRLMEGAAPFYYPGNDIGCLLIHGLTGSPNELRWMGQDLNRRGYTVCGVRLAGHGSHPNDLAEISWREMYLDALAGFQMLRASCRKVFVGGMSTGGAISLIMAASEPVDGVIAMSTPYMIPSIARLPAVMYVLGLMGTMIPKKRNPVDHDALAAHIIAEQTKRGENPIGRVNYPVMPARSVMALGALLTRMRRALPEIRVPVLLAQSKIDPVVPFEHAHLIYDALTSAEKSMLVLTDSRHTISEDHEKDIVF